MGQSRTASWKYSFNVNFPRVLETISARLPMTRLPRRRDDNDDDEGDDDDGDEGNETTTTTKTTMVAAASCFLFVVGSKGESWCFSDEISEVVTSGADRSHSGLQICHPQPARPYA